jgi:LemA protein
MAKKKSKTKIWLIVGGVILVVLILWLMMGYNKLVGLDNSVDESWANVETQYQRRLDLIPNLVNTVEGAVAFEKETQTQIAALRTGVAQAKQALSSAVTPEQQQAALAESDAVVSRFQGLNINVENYPQLKATENFLSLQD